jgi:hypothetical protein
LFSLHTFGELLHLACRRSSSVARSLEIGDGLEVFARTERRWGRRERVQEHLGSLLIQFGALLLGEKLLIRVFGRPLQRRVEFVGPDALEIGLSHFTTPN